MDICKDVLIRILNFFSPALWNCDFWHIRVVNASLLHKSAARRYSGVALRDVDSGHGGNRVIAELDDLRGLSQHL